MFLDLANSEFYVVNHSLKHAPDKNLEIEVSEETSAKERKPRGRPRGGGVRGGRKRPLLDRSLAADPTEKLKPLPLKVTPTSKNCLVVVDENGETVEFR